MDDTQLFQVIRTDSKTEIVEMRFKYLDIAIRFARELEEAIERNERVACRTVLIRRNGINYEWRKRK